MLEVFSIEENTASKISYYINILYLQFVIVIDFSVLKFYLSNKAFYTTHYGREKMFFICFTATVKCF